MPLFAAVRAAWRRRADEFEAQSLANVAWGWAALELRRRRGRCFRSRMLDFEPVNATSIATGCPEHQL